MSDIQDCDPLDAVDVEAAGGGSLHAPAQGFLSVDIACVMTRDLVQAAQQQGLKAALLSQGSWQQQQEEQGMGEEGDTGKPSDGSGAPNSGTANDLRRLHVVSDSAMSTSSSGRSCTLSGETFPEGLGTCAGSVGGVFVAVEVDGPTHVAVNCADHALGATVCRNWLLQQWGWVVLVVPWWQWQEKPSQA